MNDKATMAQVLTKHAHNEWSDAHLLSLMLKAIEYGRFGESDDRNEEMRAEVQQLFDDFLVSLPADRNPLTVIGRFIDDAGMADVLDNNLEHQRYMENTFVELAKNLK